MNHSLMMAVKYYVDNVPGLVCIAVTVSEEANSSLVVMRRETVQTPNGPLLEPRLVMKSSGCFYLQVKHTTLHIIKLSHMNLLNTISNGSC